jgi:predicted heme/steroid binding protein
MRLLTLIFASVISSIALYYANRNAKRILMTFFRDISRYKARKRLYGNSAALIPLLFGKEDDVDLLVDPGSDDFTMTIEQLLDMNGSTDTTPVYISVKGNIYDVSSARAMYGPGGSYHGFAGRDATRGFATGCLETECMVSSIDGLTDSELKEIDRWVELYHNHDKYTYVGRLVTVDPLDSVVSDAIRGMAGDPMVEL